MKSAITAVSIPNDYVYKRLTNTVLVPTKITVSVEPHGTRKVQLHPLALPFGFLDRVSVSAAGKQFRVKVEVMKATGHCNSGTLNRNNNEFNVTYADTSNEDAMDDDIVRAMDETGHCLKNRMIAAASIAYITLDFEDDIPDRFTVEYYGANALPAHAADAVGPKFPFLFPPMTPKARMERITNSLRSKRAPEEIEVK